MGRSKAWTDKEKEYLIKSWPDPNLTTDEITLNLGRTKNAVNNMAHRLGLKRPVFVNPIGTWGPDAFKLLSCYGKTFRNDCIDSCPGWLKCMEIFTVNEVADRYQLTGKTMTISGVMSGSQVVAVIRAALAGFDQCEVLE